MSVPRFLIGLLSVLLVTAAAVSVPRVVSASTTAPQRMVYNGHLLDASGAAVTTAHTIRFSLWTSADFVASDVTATGAISSAAPEYADWQEIFTVTPNSDGYFTVELGSTTALPDFSSLEAEALRNLHLQVEVKAAGAADTAYELLDRDSSDDTIDRAALLSVPFALNADLLDGRDTGTGSGNIVVLQSGGLLPVSTIPGATQSSIFILDHDDTESGEITLQFGQTLAKKLTYDIVNSYFDFNDAVNIQGNLTVEGGVTIGEYRPSAGTGAGTLRFNGADIEAYTGHGWTSLTKGAKFVGVTSVTTQGSIASGELQGYQAANALCAADYPGSRMCQTNEVISTIDQDINAFTNMSNAWISEGAPGYTADSNDCRGWTSANGTHLGAWWEFSTDGGASIAAGGGIGYLTNCAVNQPIACCR